MATAYSARPVDDIKERLDVAEVLAEYVKLIPAGSSRYKVLCPFHHEKTPSLMVSKERQSWHCFGCGKGGDIFSFVQEIDGVDFPEALRMLAKKANVELRPADPAVYGAKARLLEALKLAAAFYRKALTDSQSGSVARQYVQQRGIQDETAETFFIGFSPTSWDGLLNFLTKKGFSQQEAFDAGLAVKRERTTGYYDRFRGRLMFPIRDVNGSVVGFGGRILEAIDGDASSGAKYINTPETMVYRKGSILYGLDKAKHSIKQADLAVLVEGYMDYIASYQAGVTNVVAVSGTALTEQQVRLLKRYTSNVALAFDADLAGSEAARRGIDLALAADIRVKVITLPNAKDPDELIKQDPALWRNAISQSERIIDYAFNRALAGANLDDVDDKKRVAKTLLPVIARLVDPIEQTHYLQRLSGKLGVEERVLRETLKQVRSNTSLPRPYAQPAAESVRPPAANPVAERALALAVFAFPELFRDLSELIDTDDLQDHDLEALYRHILLYYSESQQLDPKILSEHLAKELPALSNLIARLAFIAERDFVGSERTNDDLTTARKELTDAVRLLRRTRIRSNLRQIETQLRSVERSGSAEALDPLLSQMRDLTDELRRLDAE